jgi:ABC-type Fe3+ transport system substrate-binding protein
MSKRVLSSAKLNVRYLLTEEFQIISFDKGRQLRKVVQPEIDQLPNIRTAKQAEECLQTSSSSAMKSIPTASKTSPLSLNKI